MSDNVQTWDDVADLPWHEALEMSCPAEVPAVLVPQRRAADTRTMADVVEAIACDREAWDAHQDDIGAEMAERGL